VGYGVAVIAYFLYASNALDQQNVSLLSNSKLILDFPDFPRLLNALFWARNFVNLHA